MCEVMMLVCAPVIPARLAETARTYAHDQIEGSS